jgi:hypothetical protein
MTNNEAINILLIHSAHWTRLTEEKICGMKEGKEAVQALDMAINALEQEPCEDCISREDVYDVIDDAVLWGYPEKEFYKAIRNLPPVQPKQMTGRWIDEGDAGNGNRYCHCSECGKGDEQAKTQVVPYCWWCGAKMQEVEE